jgi:hypothetical protein
MRPGTTQQLKVTRRAQQTDVVGVDRDGRMSRQRNAAAAPHAAGRQPSSAKHRRPASRCSVEHLSPLQSTWCSSIQLPAVQSAPASRRTAGCFPAQQRASRFFAGLRCKTGLLLFLWELFGFWTTTHSRRKVSPTRVQGATMPEILTPIGDT